MTGPSEIPGQAADRPGPADRRLSFGAVASDYDRYRPGYPAEAVTWLLAPAGAGPLRVVDLGAGTGRLTRALLTAGHDVVAVEPDPGMREVLASASPGAEVLAGSAEAVPLPDGSADAVVAGQAWHWFDPVAAPAEAARLLRPGGVLGVVWNVRDDLSTPWVAELERVVEGQDSASRTLREAGPRLPEPFGPAEAERFRHDQPLKLPDDLVGLVASFSYVRLRPDADAVLAAVAELARRLPPGSSLPYLAQCYRSVRG